jgi:Carbohydrate binding module (family 6)
MTPSRRTVLGAALGGVAAAGLPATAHAAPTAPAEQGTAAAQAAQAVPRAASALQVLSWQQRWAPSASTDGLNAFETVEDDRADSHPAGQPHIYPEGNNFRWNMHMVDRDTMTDRQRQEVTGMRTGSGSYLEWHAGETWRTTYSLYVPSSLKATTTFTHIMQMKMPGTGSDPIVVQSLRRVNGAQTIELVVVSGNVLVGRTSLDQLHDSWVDVDFQITIGDGTSGAVQWSITKAGTQLVYVSRTGVDTFIDDRVRPKWGIYRSLGDTSGSLEDCYLLTTNMRGYQLVAGGSGVYQGEDARISQGTVDSDHQGFTGTGFVNLTNVTGSYAEWTVRAVSAASATLGIRYANGTTTDRPMDIAVNGKTVSAGHSFGSTGTWDTWKTSSLTVPLAAGVNKIRTTSTTGNGGPNIDSISIS